MMEMMTLVFKLGLLVLASDAVIRGWRLSSIFAGTRAYLEEFKGFLPELLGCSFCMSFHVPYILGVFYLMSWSFGSWIFEAPIWLLACISLTSRLNREV